ncbi:hypothetical protein [Vulgatibacter sp.]|uniref:hypothetical protein n=1 Tax=Vulgatibacter sp. TaxID=1971226 RepID=UPI003562CD5D
MEETKKAGVRGWLATVNGRVQGMVKEYGAVAVVMLLAASAANIAGFYAALSLGFAEADVGAGTGGTLAAAWVASRATKPLANIAALALTPLAARVWRRGRSS